MVEFIRRLTNRRSENKRAIAERLYRADRDRIRQGTQSFQVGFQRWTLLDAIFIKNIYHKIIFHGRK